MALRDIERKGASLANCAGEANFAAEQSGDFPADSQAQAGPPIPAAGAAISLLEGFEDDLLFLRGDANPGVGNRECNDTARMIERFAVLAPAFGHQRHAED